MKIVDINRYYSTFLQPAKCETCGKVFSKKGHLDRHVRTIHMGMKDESAPCPHCGKIFTTKSSLEPHIEAVHKGMYLNTGCANKFCKKQKILNLTNIVKIAKNTEIFDTEKKLILNKFG